MLGVAVLASVFARQGGYATAVTFVDGLVPALWIGAAVVAAGAVVALLVPRRRGPAEAIDLARDDLVAQAEAA